MALSLVLAGPALARHLGDTAGLGAPFKWAWLVLQWPLVFTLASTAIGLVYFGPDADQDWVWVSPGAVVATGLLLVASFSLKLYIANFTDYNAAYDAVGGVIVLLLWFYLTGIAIVVGAELNSEIEHASPYGKDPGEKTASGKRLLGRRAARAFEERQRATRSGQVLRLKDEQVLRLKDESGGQVRLPSGWWVDVAPEKRATSVAPKRKAIGVPRRKGQIVGSNQASLRLQCLTVATRV